MGIHLLNPPEPWCNPTSTQEGRSRPDNDGPSNNEHHSGVCGRCRCVPMYYRLRAGGSTGLNSNAGDHILERQRYPDIPITDAGLDDFGACVWRSLLIPWNGPGNVDAFFWYLTSSVPIHGSSNGDWGAILWHGESQAGLGPNFYSTWVNASSRWKCLGSNSLIKVADVGTGIGIGNITVEPWWP